MLEASLQKLFRFFQNDKFNAHYTQFIFKVVILTKEESQILFGRFFTPLLNYVRRLSVYVLIDNNMFKN
ncbi:hypothetical protein QWT87_06295 [Chryseobacterium sp. APV1]|uniref:Uncharacterized protein n=1 Tax=Chryseobacterium urinae TaxID=3058400 RepID=A0ABT8U343_9FLAO|nr:hypothetical protein [Chryseobacterium sp. APV1]MDO3424495.1 hypothetical protein [Chryseobacterium sp. APV1]